MPQLYPLLWGPTNVAVAPSGFWVNPVNRFPYYGTLKR